MDALELRVAAGEQQFGRWEFYRLVTEGRVDIIQPGVLICGGITEMRKIAAIASIFDIFPTTAALHFWASTLNARYPQEYDFHAVRVDYGADKPGLGVELDPAEISKLSA